MKQTHLIVASVTMKAKASHRMRVVRICRYFVFCTSQKAKGPTTQTKRARATR